MYSKNIFGNFKSSYVRKIRFIVSTPVMGLEWKSLNNSILSSYLVYKRDYLRLAQVKEFIYLCVDYHTNPTVEL